MAMPDDAIKQLMAVLEGLLLAENTAGDRIIYTEHRESTRNTVVMTMCRVCGELDGHKDECAVNIAERVLRRLQGAS